MSPRLPGNTTVGVLGGGQLGRMLALEARRMGYEVVQWTGSPGSGPAELSSHVIEGAFDDPAALADFLEHADVATVEFENIPAPLLEAVDAKIPMAPGPHPVITAQHREREKTFLGENRFPCAPFWIVDSAETLAVALAELPEGAGGILKTAEFGYDGKGQSKVERDGDAAAIWDSFGAPRAVLEQRIELAGELSVIVARAASGELVAYDPVENFHRDHILDISIIPARLPGEVLNKATDLAREIANTLEYVGTLAVEFFISKGGDLLVNELAPRPHNSGHHTLDACETSQFEQQLRAVCGLPLGSTRLTSPTVMSNLLGDVWDLEGGAEPDWTPILATPGAHLHLYGKKAAREGRKMGHITYTAPTLDEALANAMAGRAALGIPDGDFA